MVQCQYCRFYHDQKCKRHAPRVIALVEYLFEQKVAVSKPWGGWPLVKPEDCCAEGVPK
jgi:hypothetical protein